jgi:hypothetical protein
MRSPVLFIVLLGCVFASCSSSTAPPVTRMATLSTSSLDFGDTRTGVCADSTLDMPSMMTFTIKNTGNDTLRIDSIISSSSSVSVVSSPKTVAPADNGTVKVEYCPTDTVATNATLTIKSNSTESASTLVTTKGTGIHYYPYAGSSFTYTAVQLDTAQRPIGNWYTTTGVIDSSSISYAGKTNVAYTSDSVYIHVENNGDVSVYNAGFPVYPYPKRAGAGWFRLPAATHAPTFAAFDTTFDSAGVTVTLHVRDTCGWLKDTVVNVAGHSFTCAIVALQRVAVFQSGIFAGISIAQFGAWYSPTLGFTVGQKRWGGDIRLINGKPVSGHSEGEIKVLTAYKLK